MKAAPKRVTPARPAPKQREPLRAEARRQRQGRGALPAGRAAGEAPAGPRKTFALHWGKGVIEEEVQAPAPHHVPTIQLLRFLEGEAAGTYEVRFCHYDHNGRFQRSPLIVGAKDLVALRRALARAPRLKRLLAKLVK